MKATNNCIVITNNNHCSTWLYGLNDSVSNLIFVEPSDKDRIASLLDTVDVDFALVHLPSQNKDVAASDKNQALIQELGMVESLVASKPALAVIALVETIDQEVVLPIIRSGARDIIQIGTPAHEVHAVMKRHQKRSGKPTLTPQQERGQAYTLLNARASDGNTLFCMHMALEMQKYGSTLLLDIGNPNADIMLILGLASKFSLLDVVQNRTRLDATLIETGFARHVSGLSLLSMPEDSRRYTPLSPADLNLVLYALKRHFDYIFINLAGTTDIEQIKAALAISSGTFVLVEQTIHSCKRNLDLLETLRQLKVTLPDNRLVVDRMMPNTSPRADNIAESFGMPLGGTLPCADDLRLKCINTGEPIFSIAPNSSYAISIKKLVGNLPDIQSRARSQQPESFGTRLKAALDYLVRGR